MRVAVLELAFRGLGAVAATSGLLEGNRSSARVSEKLGYVETGISEISPRGVPVPHHDLRLEREDWVAPFPVEISGLEPALPLFGAARDPVRLAERPERRAERLPRSEHGREEVAVARDPRAHLVEA